mmetsp:Transcript_8963/g.10761  ORF Transcript_8963/g.10761 Transcript_8963/m.10761 type:complete len:2332 (-) Transcript_8963:118-7113(-)
MPDFTTPVKGPFLKWNTKSSPSDSTVSPPSISSTPSKESASPPKKGVMGTSLDNVSKTKTNSFESSMNTKKITPTKKIPSKGKTEKTFNPDDDISTTDTSTVKSTSPEKSNTSTTTTSPIEKFSSFCTSCSSALSEKCSNCTTSISIFFKDLKTQIQDDYEEDKKKAFIKWGLPLIAFLIVLIVLITCLVLLLPKDIKKKSNRSNTYIYPSNISYVLTSGEEYYIADSIEDSLYKINRINPTTNEIVSVGRSYDGYQWEILTGATFEFDCNIENGFCVITIPDHSTDNQDQDDESDQGIYYEIFAVGTKRTFKTFDDNNKAAMLLMQATFGQTRDTISDFINNKNGDVSTWITSQMNETMWSHREYYRKRANTRLDVPTSVGSIRMPCDIGSRWHKVAFTEEDIGKTVTVSSISSSSLSLSIDGVIRTDILKTLFINTTMYGWSFVICDVDEFINGDIEITTLDNDDCDLEFLNLEISISNLQIEYTLINSTSYSLFTELSDVPNIYLFNGNGNDDMISCDYPIGTPIFVNTLYGMLKYDPRIITLTNTIEVPINDFSSSADHDCPSVVKTFLNVDGCIADRKSCSPIQYSSALFELNETMIRSFFTLGNKYVYYVTGLRLDDDDIPTPCNGETSRWINRKNESNTYTCDETTFSNSTIKTIITNKLISTLNDDDEQQGMSRVREIIVSCDDDDDELIGAKILINDECWEHAHPDEYSVYDFSIWTRAHPGGSLPIEQFAVDEDPKIRFPQWHDMSRWSTGESEITYMGKLGEIINFANLETSVQQIDIANLIGAVGARSDEGFEVCGSPGEVGNDPTLGNMYRLLLGDDTTVYNQVLDQEEDPSYSYQKSVVWTSVSFKATDQLRQRVAWALSQIFVINQDGVNLNSAIESYSVYYDIFVRNAFGNYRDVLREVSYSPMMAKMLTYLQSKSYDYGGTYPDENYAREVMQLFTIGLYQLNEDGTHKLDDQGNSIPTYGNDDILNFARAWTGFDRQSGRGNIEADDIEDANNHIDPMQLKSNWRDILPKKDLYDGYIGDGYPLCGKKPSTLFLKKGAIYRYRGQNPLPELIEDPSEYGNDNDHSIKRFNLNISTSSLYAFLCNGSTSPINYQNNNNGEQQCNFKSQIILTETLSCDGNECDVDTARVVRFNYTHNDTTVPVYYEYVEPPCIDLPFTENATTVSSRGGRQWDSNPKCVDKSLYEAQGTCCLSPFDNDVVATPLECEYYGEKISFFKAQSRCRELGMDVCKFKRSDNSDCLDSYYVWSTRNCTTDVQIESNGLIEIIHESELEWETDMPLDNDNYFEVKWLNDSYPSVDMNSCNNEYDGCSIHGDTCYCKTEIISSPVFIYEIPTIHDIETKLRIGAFDPSLYDNDEYVECTTISNDNVTIYVKTSLSSSCINLDFNIDVIFEIKDQTDESLFYLNLESIVQVGNGAYEFRNPPMMISVLEPTVRDAQYEVEAVFDHLMGHPNTPPFVAYRMIQRFVSSNPSPRYVKAVARAFKIGTYQGYGTGKRGDLAATIAAVLLDQEARSTTLLHDPNHGQLREPLIKLIHFMRAMEFKQSFGHPELFLNAMDFAQSPYAQPSVFNFFLPEYQPSGPIALANLFSPESQILAAPYIVNFLNGLISMIKWGLTDCYEGFAIIDGSVCSTSKLKTPELYWAGNLSYTPSQHALSTKDIIKELDLLLTGGRLNEKGYEVIEYAYDTVLDGEGYSPYDNLQAAQKLMMMSPEFHSTNMNILKSDEDGNRNDVENNTSTNEIKPYKAIIYLYLDGAMDSFNLIVPHSNCQNQTYEDLYQHYVDIREELALTQDELLTIEVPNNTQPCNTFGIHPTLDILQTLYNEQDGLFFANVGPLIEPIYSKEEYENGAKDIPGNLFAHNIQQLAVHTVYAELQATAKGVLGRIWDLMASSTYGFTTGSYSIAGNTRALDPDTSESYDVIDKNNGVTNLDSSELSSGMIKLMMNNLTNIKSNSIFSETWQTELRSTKKRSQILYDALDGIELEQTWSDDSDGTLGKQLEQVAYLIKANQDTLKNERDAFYVTLGGFDTHSDLGETLETLFDDVNNALTSFVEEMKLQGLWENVTIIEVSEFGRTITSNGLGTDHGWGGNSFILGGSVKGGQILGQYPSDLSDDGPQNIGRGRLIPTTSWESLWNAVGGWMGIVDESNMNTMLPHLINFDEDDIVSSSQAFTDEGLCTATSVSKKKSNSEEEIWTDLNIALVASSSVIFFFMLVGGGVFLYLRYKMGQEAAEKEGEGGGGDKKKDNSMKNAKGEVVVPKSPTSAPPTNSHLPVFVSTTLSNMRSTLDRRNNKNRESPSIDRPSKTKGGEPYLTL